MKLILDNNQSKIEASAKDLLKIMKHPLFTFRKPGAFFSRAFRLRQWDGYIRFIDNRGHIPTGKVPQLIEYVKDKLNKDIDIIDIREDIKPPKKIPKRLGDLVLRKNQRDSIRAIVNNTLPDGTYFPRGIVKAATNAGKTLICAGIHKAYNLKTLFIINSKDLYQEAMSELPKYIPGEFGWISSDHGIKWADFMVVMVKTGLNKMDNLAPKLAKYKVVLVDECDLSTSETYKKFLQHTYNAPIKIGLSGSALVDLRKTKQEKNEKIRGQFGDIISEITNKQQMDKGYSSKVIVNIWQGNEDVKIKGDFRAEYELGIIRSKARNNKVLRRVRRHIEMDRTPILIIVKNHAHIEELFKPLEKLAKKYGKNADWVHHKKKGRFDISKQFKEGNIDILLGSYILKRGKNFPLMKALINASGGDSMENTLQILGRATRAHSSKDKTFLDDFHDEGAYLKRHSNRRFRVYRDEKLKVTRRYIDKLL